MNYTTTPRLSITVKKFNDIKNNKIQTIGQVRDLFLEHYSLKEYTQASSTPAEFLAYCQKEWKELAGQASNFSYPTALKANTLIINIKHSVYLTDFQFQKDKLKKELKKRSDGLVQTIRTKISRA